MRSPLFAYDKAVYDLIHSLYDETLTGSPDEIFNINAKRHHGKVVLPFIGIWRIPDFSLNLDLANDSFLRKGFVSLTKDSKGIEFPNQRVSFHGMPVTLQYQIDIYASKRDVCDGLTAELMMYLRENPYVNVQIPDAGNYVIQFNLDLDESVTDNTDITGFDDSNRFYRLTLTANITDAVIFRLDDMSSIEKIYVDWYVDNDTKKNDDMSFVTEDNRAEKDKPTNEL